MSLAPRPTSHSTQQVSCPSCGTEQELPENAGEDSCAICAEPLTRTGVAPVEKRPLRAALQPPSQKESQPVSTHPESSKAARQELSAIVAQGPQDATPHVIAEMVRSNKRLASVLSLIPIVGPRLIRESDLLSSKEKSNLRLVSTTLSGVAAFTLLLLLPSPAQRIDTTRLRILAELDALGEFAEDYRSQNDGYPTAEAWRRYADRSDSRFFDPWVRPYIYETTPDGGVTLSTLGRDGAPGGIGEDSDVEKHFIRPAS